MTVLPDPISHTVTAVMDAYAAGRTENERTYLGASEIGVECERALWYSFRWTSRPERIDGRMAWLFDTGHVEEERMILALGQVAGIEVKSRGEDGQQLGFTSLGGHFRGHLDGMVRGLSEAPTTPHVLECKTHNEKSFKETQKHGVAKSKPQHFAQMQVYMDRLGFTRALYLFENKNTSELASERVEYSAVDAARIMAKADRVIHAPRPLPKLFEDPQSKAAFPCTYCRHRGPCHEGGWARLNCRTCLHSTPIDGGWWCERHAYALDVATQKIGCASHLFIPELVPGEQVDASEVAESVTYRLKGGETWVDGVVA